LPTHIRVAGHLVYDCHRHLGGKQLIIANNTELPLWSNGVHLFYKLRKPSKDDIGKQAMLFTSKNMWDPAREALKVAQVEFGKGKVHFRESSLQNPAQEELHSRKTSSPENSLQTNLESQIISPNKNNCHMKESTNIISDVNKSDISRRYTTKVSDATIARTQQYDNHLSTHNLIMNENTKSTGHHVDTCDLISNKNNKKYQRKSCRNVIFA